MAPSGSTTHQMVAVALAHRLLTGLKRCRGGISKILRHFRSRRALQWRNWCRVIVSCIRFFVNIRRRHKLSSQQLRGPDYRR